MGSEGSVVLANGRRVWLRPLCPADAPRLGDLWRRLSPETIRKRFLRERTRCSPGEAEDLASVDGFQRVAIAVTTSPSEDSDIVAVGRFHRHDGTAFAELALLVQDDYQRVGLGRLLLNRLYTEASRQRLRALDGYVLYDNAAVLCLLRSSGWPLDVRWYGGDVLRIELSCC